MDVITERSVYKEALNKAKSSVTSHFTRDDIFSPPLAGTVAPNSTPVIAHYSFDMAQQVLYPNDPLQPALCTVQLLGSVQYLECAVSPFPKIDEAVDMRKGSNAIISMLHHFFVHHGLDEKWVYLHADNCGGQNINATMVQVQYLLWRVMSGQIKLSFMIPGLTKFSPDWCFGLKKYRRTKVGGLTDLVVL